MDLVLGLSITPAAVRLVLVEGAAGDGDTVDHDVIDIATVRAAADTSDLLETVLRNRVIATARDHRPHSIGVTWTAEAATEGSRLLEALAAAGFEDFLAVSEWDAAEALTAGIADLTGTDDVGVCIVEADAAVVAVANSQGTLVDRIDRRAHNGDTAALVGTLVPMLGRPEAIFVFGSAHDVTETLSMLRSAIASPVVSAAEADLALAKGAALAAARALAAWELVGTHPPVTASAPGDDAPAPTRAPKVGALASVLAAAVLTFVVSLSLAIGLALTPQTQKPEVASAADVPAQPAKPPAETAPAPTHFGAVHSGPIVAPPEAALSAPEAPPVVEEPEAVEPAPVYGPVEPVPAAPEPEPAYVPPTADYVPPSPAPVYVPPNTPVYQPPPQPRLRDRIIEKIPILNRFHQPQPYYP